MDQLQGRMFRTSLKAWVDIAGGGHFFWGTYYDSLVFKHNGRVKPYRV